MSRTMWILLACWPYYRLAQSGGRIRNADLAASNVQRITLPVVTERATLERKRSDSGWQQHHKLIQPHSPSSLAPARADAPTYPGKKCRVLIACDASVTHAGNHYINTWRQTEFRENRYIGNRQILTSDKFM